MNLSEPTFLLARKLVAVTFAFILAGVVILLNGCGGSTSGTGGITVSGRVFNESSAPLPGLTVTLLQTGAQTESGADGGFALISPVSGELDLKFESEAVNAQTKITSVPADAERVTATFTVKDNGSRVDAGDVEIRRRKQRDPIEGDDNDDDRDDDSDRDDDDSGKDDDSDDDENDDNSGKGNDDDSDEDKDDSSDDDSKDDSEDELDEDEDEEDDDEDEKDEEDDDDEGGNSGSGNSGSGGGGDDD